MFCRSLFVFSGVRVALSLVFCVVFCRSLFVFSGVHVALSLVFCVVFCKSLFVFSGVRVALSLVFCVVFCKSLFVFSGVRVVLSLVFCVVFCKSLLVLCPFYFSHCIVCLSIDGFWLPFLISSNFPYNVSLNLNLNIRTQIKKKGYLAFVKVIVLNVRLQSVQSIRYFETILLHVVLYF